MRCPKILLDIIEEEIDDNEYNNDDSKNPIIDNLYLDMNGIIHPCTHPEHLVHNIKDAIFKYIYSLFQSHYQRKKCSITFSNILIRL